MAEKSDDLENKGLLEEEPVELTTFDSISDSKDEIRSDPLTTGADDEDDDDEEDEGDLTYQAETVVTILKPVCITMLIVIWAVKSITLPASTASSAAISIYQESEGDSTGSKIVGSLLNAIIMLAAVILSTIAIVILYKYRCLKIIYGWLITSSLLMLAMFGGMFFYFFLEANNWAFDYISFAFMLWNFSVVGILAVFWHAPTKVNQGYLIVISSLLAIFFTRLPDWTTFAILAVISIYDLVAVLAPCGPLKILVETAQQRQEPIPALLYNASVYIMMAKEDDEQDSESRSRSRPEPIENVTPKTGTTATEEVPKRRRGVKLGLGDFIFYSVLIGRAALFNMITVFTTFIAIVTGLFLTLLLLAIFRKALPALPISIFLGMLFYFLTRIFLLPFVMEHGKYQIFV